MASNQDSTKKKSSKITKRPAKKAQQRPTDDDLSDSDNTDDDDAFNGPPQKRQKLTDRKEDGDSSDGDNAHDDAVSDLPPLQQKKLADIMERITCANIGTANAPNVVPTVKESVYPTTTDQAAAISGAKLFADQLSSDLAKSWTINTSQYYQAQDYTADTRLDPTKPPRNPIASNKTTALQQDIPPVHNIKDIFDIIARKAVEKNLQKAIEPFLKQGLRLVTMCSGTESPILAMKQLANSLERKGLPSFQIEHLASAEIEPFKQAYIQRNFEPKILFRDVTEFSENKKYAHTAFGGLVEQPTSVHILIAGSSCVDYSSLNSHTKAWGEKGQSHDTMMGVFDYAKRVRPAIVILENVQTAPWDKVCELWAKGGYYCVGMFLDSKDFYVPQTRERGYVIAFDIERAQNIGLDLEKAKKTVTNIMRHLSQRASSPYTDFIYKDDDPELRLAKQVLSTSADADRTGRDWEACRVRYNRFRVEHGLGNARPLTLWKSGGKSQVSDYIWTEWATGQRERILDTIDIKYLACASSRHYDITSKSRILELSQNVDRDSEGRHWGIISCITPSGMPWDTLRGGPLSGREVLALQGIPVDDLSLNEENSRQLQDLAGNAMTSTVVGCVIISAIIASHVDVVHQNKPSNATNLSMFQIFNTVASNDQNDVPRSSQSMVAPYIPKTEASPNAGPLHRCQTDLFDASADMRKIKEQARASLQLCKCDERFSSPISRFYRCRLCGHTACNRCAGNPRHDYEEITADVQSFRISPDVFISAVTDALPPALNMNIPTISEAQIEKILDKACHLEDREFQPDKSSAHPLDKDDLDRYKTAVSRALHSTVYFQAVKPSSMWRVVFESAEARLELRFFPSANDFSFTANKLQQNPIECIWLLYARPSPDEKSVSVVRDLLSRPIARMEPTGKNFLEGNWEFWDPSMPYAYVDIMGIGQYQPSWEQKLGLQRPVFRTLQVFPKLRILKSLGHDNQLDQKAKSILDNLCGDFELLANCGTACGSLHRRVTPATNKHQPVWMFLDSKPMQNGYLDRIAFAKDLFRMSNGVHRPVTAELQKAWRPNSSTIKGFARTAMRVPCRLVDYWHDNTGLSLSDGTTQQEKTVWKAKDIKASPGNCTNTVPILAYKLPTEKIPQNQWASGKQHTINLIDSHIAAKDFQYALKRLDLSEIFSSETVQLNGIGPNCSTCAPRAPGLKWCHTRGKSKGPAIVRPFEIDKEATDHEKALRDRPAPITAEIHIEGDHTWLVVLINPSTIAHRLCAKLLLNSGTGKTTWRFVRSDGFGDLPVFTKPEIRQDPSTQLWPNSDPLYVNAPSVLKPRRFGSRQLWEGQRKALARMLTVEQGTNWLEWDAEIFDLPALNQQFQVEVTNEVSILGGIIADEVGAGKTTTALALIARGLENFPNNSHIPTSTNTRRIRSRATLVLVPKNILSQWKDEIKTCFGIPKPSVVILTGKENASIDQLKSADIILTSWGIFGQNDYWKLLSKFCCAPNKPDKAGRAFNQWIEEAIGDIEDIVSNCGTNMDPKEFNNHRNTHKEEKKKKYTAFGAFATDTDTKERKKKQDDALDKLTTGRINPDALNDDDELIDTEFNRVFAWDPADELPAILHLFEFERIIVDEFTYLDAQQLKAVQKLKAKYRWMLSGTPPISNTESINSMATLVGAKISSETSNKHAFSFKDAKSIGVREKSWEEEFREKIQKRSLTWTLKHNERCTLFVDTLVRKNPAPPSTVREIVELVVVHQSPLEAYIYNQTFQHMTGQPLRFGVAKAKQAGSTRMEKQLVALQGTKSPEEALLTCHALFTEDYLTEYHGSTNKELYDALVKEIRDETKEKLDDIQKLLQEAYWYWNHGQASDDDGVENSHFITYLDCILRRSFGDRTASNLLSWVTANARQNPVKPSVMMSGKPGSNQYSIDEVHNLKTRQAEMQKRASDLNMRSMSLANQIQRLRLLMNVSCLVDSSDKIECGDCNEAVHANELTMLAQCGHLVCKDCLSKNSSSWDIDSCPVDSCAAATKDCRIPASTYTVATSSTNSVYGTKMDAMIAKVESINEKERILIFIQFDAHKDQLASLLRSHSIKFADGTKFSAKTISNFQKGNLGERVLLLRIDSVDSAGWNLQVANHVMFVHPYLSRSQYDYDATMTQAVGRALRYGQKKDVHVYFFISTITQDVNILQSRTGKKLVKGGSEEYILGEWEDEAAKGQENLAGPSLD